MREGPNPSGLCMCGCGQQTTLATITSNKRGNVAGQPVRYLHGHAGRKFLGPPYAEEDRGHSTPCWVWRHSLTADGYASAPWSLRSRSRLMHRNLYEERHGEVPEGLELDHLCRVRACVNPDHLEAVTHLENVRRGAKTKLTPEVRAAVKAAQGTYDEIGEMFGLSRASVWRARCDRYDERRQAA